MGEDMLKYDLIGRMVSRWKITPAIAFWGCLLIIGVGEQVLLPWLGNYPDPVQQGPKFVVLRIQVYGNGFVLDPMIWAVYVWSISMHRQFADSLIRNQVVEKQGRRKLMEAVERYEQVFTKPWIGVLVWLGPIISMLAVFYMWFFVYDPWFGRENWGHFAFTVLAVFILYYSLIWFVLRELVFIIWLYIFFRNQGAQLEIKVSHPDNAGGLGELGIHASRLGLFVLMLGLGFVVVRFTTIYYGATGSVWNTVQIVGWIAYAAVVPLSMLLLLQPAHSCMLKFRERKLLRLSNQIDLEMERLEKAIDGQGSQIAEISARLEGLRNTYSYLENKIPTWPFNASIFRQITLTTIMPVVSFVVSTAIDLMK
jgi:hypothetical protein